MRLTLREFRELLNGILHEGGLKLSPEHRRDLTPQLVRQAAGVYRDVISNWNIWLESQGMEPVKPIRPAGSSAHADKDFEEGVDAIYGDIDYLVSFPVISSTKGMEKRKAEALSSRTYIKALVQYLSLARPDNVDVEMTLRNSPQLIIIKLPGGGLVQVDTIITHPEYSEWMRGRYTPERGIKGYINGGLYKALGDYLLMQISTEGVLAREKDGQRVPSNLRKGVTVRTISKNFDTFLLDIAKEILGSDIKPDSLLLQNPGGDPDDINIERIAMGIQGLAKTLESAGILNSDEMLSTILNSFETGISGSLERKISMGITGEQEKKLLALNSQQTQRVQKAFGM